MNEPASRTSSATEPTKSTRADDVLSRRDFMLLSAAAASTLLPGCGGGGGGSGAPQNHGVLRSGAVMLPNDGSLTISNITDAGLTLSGSVPPLQPGSIIVSGAGAGLLRKVLSVSQSGGNTVAVTTPAFLDELFLSAEFGLRKNMGPADFASVVTVPGVTFSGRTSRDPLVLPFTFTNAMFTENLGNGLKDSLEYSGTLALVLDLDFLWVYDPQGLQRLRIVPTVGASGTITMTASGKWSPGPVSREFVYASATGEPIVIIVPVGGVPIPVVIVPVLTLSVKFSLSLKGGMVMKSAVGVAVSAGFDYQRATGADTVLTFTPSGSLVPEANFFATLKAELAIAQAQLTAAIFGVGGPFVGFKALSVEAVLKAETTSPRSVAFTTNAVQGGTAGLQINHNLDSHLPSIEVSLFEIKTQISKQTFLPGNDTVTVE